MGGLGAAALLAGRRRLPEGDAPLRRLGWMLLAQAVLFGGGGTRTGVLPDFVIGAHAAVAGLPLLTRDPQRYRGHFPTVRLIVP